MNRDVEREPDPGGRAAFLWPALIAGLAFAIRALPFRDVFAADRVFFIESDSYYHLRRILYAIERFPETLGHDPYLAFPTHARAIWPPFLDTAIGWLLAPFFDAGSRGAVERIVVWIPPLLGAATVWVLYRIAERHFGRRVAVAAAAILSVLSGHFWYSQLGFLDHHVFVAWLSALLLGITMDAVARAPGTPSRALLRSGAELGLLCALTLLVWPGGLLFVVLVQAALFGDLFMRAELEQARERLRRLIALDVVALVILLPFTAFPSWPQWSDFSPVVLSRFQPWLFALLAAHAALCLRLWSREGRAAPAATRIVQGIGLGLAGLAISLVLIPDLRGAASDSLQWLGRTDSFQAMVGESRPLFDLHGVFTTKIAELRLSRFFYAFPFALVALVMVSRREGRLPAALVVALWGAALFAMTLLQKRFFNSFSIPMALVFGWSCVWLRDRIAERWSSDGLGRAGVSFVVGVLALWLLLPTLAAYRAPAESFVAGLTGRAIPRDARFFQNFERQKVGEWIRDNTPPTSGLWDASLSPEYGVLARWGEGHFLKYVAERPTLVGNFGDDVGREHFLRARSFYLAQPESAAELLDELSVRYLVIRSRFERRPMALRLLEQDGAGLGRYRLAYEVGRVGGGQGQAYKVFEFVPGAQLAGRAPPGSRVEISLELTSNLGRVLMYRDAVESDGSGEYRVRLPYANRGAPPATRPGDAYRVTLGADVREVVVDEEQVQTGSVVEGPRF